VAIIRLDARIVVVGGTAEEASTSFCEQKEAKKL
jgi:hypothetical protein